VIPASWRFDYRSATSGLRVGSGYGYGWGQYTVVSSYGSVHIATIGETKASGSLRVASNLTQTHQRDAWPLIQ